ncbi:calcium-binding protein [Sphingopyxis terrae subsp. terrae NBRC 15098]|uniref:Calcium-binding protein n=1 Tax=Sphingopyxis terrae subsp. terrae NBRC 15098 TaxID=1219058 RepID=A0A142W1Y7_9SPHN|nr:calcium-binding protein [Sphingopyxis terrae]AMU96066.1 calcium-binding protein [Sphingopyxis terrae subsp. terrae NBRC 15098]
MLKQVLLIGAAAISFPALAQEAPPSPGTTPPTEQPEAAPMPDSAPAPTDTTAPVPIEPATDTMAPAGEAPAQTAPASPAPSSIAAATPAQIAQIVETEFPTYDGDKSGDLSAAEFGAWMKKLRTAQDPAVDPESADVKSWIDQAYGAADADKSGSVTKEELVAFLSRGA